MVCRGKSVVLISSFLSSLIFCSALAAHHVLGRPAYSLNEDSNTPPSMAVETQIGDFYVTYMIFPAFPKPGQRGRVNLYATRIDSGEIFDGEISFSVRDNHWYSISNEEKEEVLGVQTLDDGVYRQGFQFNENGQYIIRAYFESGDEVYDIDFPLQVGKASAVGTIGAAVGALAFILIAANVIQGKRLARAKTQSAASHKRRQQL